MDSQAELIEMWQIFMHVLVNWDVLFVFSAFFPLAVYCCIAPTENFLHLTDSPYKADF